jgi:DNA-binding NtrC family response regulator
VAGVLRRALLRPGHQVEAYTSPVVALERFRQKLARFDLAICDMVMPELCGEELAGFMRGLRPDLPVIFCSGYSPAVIMLDGEAAEMLDKPVDPAHLARQVRAALDAHGEVKTD